MKDLLKLSKHAFALLIMAIMVTSCVEDEQNPYSLNGNEGQDNAKIEVKLPNPNYISFYVGDEVVVKGSGLKDDDEIYVRFVYDEEESGEDINGDGILQKSINAKAEIKECSSEKLIFFVPEEADPYATRYTEFNVYLKRDGKEHKIGYINLRGVYNSVVDQETVILRRDEGYECAFPKDIRVYLQRFTINSETYEYEFIGEKNYLEIAELQDYYILCNCQNITGNWMLLYEANGERGICGEIHL